MNRRVLQRAILLATGLFAAYLLLWPVPIDPVTWNAPPPPPLSGDYAVNRLLYHAEKLAPGRCPGPEDVDVDGQGRIYGGLEDGRILRLTPDATLWFRTGH